jgi:hypothetical protein
MTYSLALYQSLERSDPKTAITKFRSSAAVERDVKAFKEQVANVKTTDDLFKNRRLMSFVLTGYGLESELNSIGRIKGVMMSDLSKPTSIANILKDRRYREIAGDLQMFRTGLETLKKSGTIDKLVDRYVSAQYELTISKDAPSLREARYFAKNIGKVTNVYEILGDIVLRKVVTTALGLPEQIAIQPVETQAELIKNRLDISQFRTKDAAGAGAATLRTNAQADVTALDAARRAAVAATAQTADFAGRIRAAIARYDGMAALQDPSGANAATVAVHATAVPELARMEGVGLAASAAIGRIADGLNRLSTLRRDAANPANADNFASYKDQFAAAVATIRTEIQDGADYRFEGQSFNLLDGSLSGDLTATLDTGGKTVTLRRQDLSGFLAEIDTAASAFAAATDAGDATNLGAVAAAISRGGPTLGTVRDAVIADRAANQTKIDSIPDFLAQIDTAAIQRGRDSISDSDTRMRDIAAKLVELRGIADASIARAEGADRSDLTAQMQTLRATISTMIATPSDGRDDLLGDQRVAYALRTGRELGAGGLGLASKLDGPLQEAQVDTVAAAQALRASINSTLIPAITRARDDLRTDRTVFTLVANTLDARGKLDDRVRSLQNEVAGAVSRAGVGTTNLLNAAQKAIVVTLKSATGSMTIEPETAFRQTITAKLTAAAAQLPGNPTGDGGARALLVEAATIADAANARLTTSRARSESLLFEARRRLTQAPPETSAQTAAQPTEFTKRFVQRFLALSDMQAVSGGGGVNANAPGGAMLGLFA